MARSRSGCAGILIVEDDEPIRTALEQALVEEGYVVFTAADGQEALDSLRTAEVPPCLILLDMMMPVLDGRGFLAAKKDDPAIVEIPVVVITADARALREAEELGAEDVLGKPLSLDTLLECVDRYCSRTILQ